MTAPTPPDPIEDKPNDEDDSEAAPWLTFRRTMWLGTTFSVIWGLIVLGGRWASWWTKDEAGTFGDSFAPLLGFLTVAALAAALDSVRMQRQELRLQRREIRLQRRELELTREEMRAQRLAAEEQALQVKRANELAAVGHELADKANEIALRGQLLDALRKRMDVESAREALVAKIEGLKNYMPMPEKEQLLREQLEVVEDRTHALCALEEEIVLERDRRSQKGS